ncbi:hypothetical protein R50073_39140 [Maricurvus nonylphenolicus]|uniref:hypothetical protein n=1 Tax=Maricurvus nonylphenolicus TaxID=1008307 RepID=UPI0036F20161
MKLTTLLWCITGPLAVYHSDLESREVFDGVVLPLISAVFLVWCVIKLTLTAGGNGSAGGGGFGGSGGFGGDGGCGGDGGGC